METASVEAIMAEKIAQCTQLNPRPANPNRKRMTAGQDSSVRGLSCRQGRGCHQERRIEGTRGACKLTWG